LRHKLNFMFEDDLKQLHRIIVDIVNGFGVIYINIIFLDL